MRRLESVVLLAVIGLAAASLAQAPATMPQDAGSTRPQGPRDVLKQFFSSLSKGVPDDLAPCCYASNAEGQRLVDDLSELAGAVAALHKSASARFGAQAVEPATPLMISPDAVDEATEKISGDSALVQGPRLPPVPMIRRDGLWKLDVLEFANGNGSTSPRQAHRVFSALAAAMRATAGRIDAGQFATIEAMEGGVVRAQAEAMSAARAER